MPHFAHIDSNNTLSTVNMPVLQCAMRPKSEDTKRPDSVGLRPADFDETEALRPPVSLLVFACHQRPGIEDKFPCPMPTTSRCDDDFRVSLIPDDNLTPSLVAADLVIHFPLCFQQTALWFFSREPTQVLIRNIGPRQPASSRIGRSFADKRCWTDAADQDQCRAVADHRCRVYLRLTSNSEDLRLLQNPPARPL